MAAWRNTGKYFHQTQHDEKYKFEKTRHGNNGNLCDENYTLQRHTEETENQLYDGCRVEEKDNKGNQKF